MSAYRELVKTLLGYMRRYPSMYLAPVSIESLDCFIGGYEYAWKMAESEGFVLAEVLEDPMPEFTRDFTCWLGSVYGVQSSSGWIHLVERASKEQGVDGVELFFDLAEKFFEDW